MMAKKRPYQLLE